MRKSRIFVYATLLFILLGLNCSGPESDQPLLTAEVPLHLEEHLETATVTGSEVPEDIPQPVIWSFDEVQPEWKAHQALAEYFTRSKESPLTPEQLETLRSLGYIR
ncbi:MAG: hypothetical protein OEZ52_00775 [Candidatus Aminicenantes bacterium]|nr:hypothetical protein [Candidatus Aminicenantes bacterium]MDH5742056.1 hypothetical protein [Candidatus Aminicenantes bacterium]